MGARSKRPRRSHIGKKRWNLLSQRISTTLTNKNKEEIGFVDNSGSIWIFGDMPEMILESMIGKRLCEVIAHPSLCRDVRIDGFMTAENSRLLRRGWAIQTQGYPLLPRKIAEKRRRDASHG